MVLAWNRCNWTARPLLQPVALPNSSLISPHGPARRNLRAWNVVAVGAAEPVVLAFHRLDHPGGDGLPGRYKRCTKSRTSCPVIHLAHLSSKRRPGHVAVEHQALRNGSPWPERQRRRRQALGVAADALWRFSGECDSKLLGHGRDAVLLMATVRAFQTRKGVKIDCRCLHSAH